MSSAQEQSIRTICGFCHTNCGLIVRVKNGVIQSIRPDPQHPVNMGGACPKGLAGKEVVYAPERLLHPLRKTKSGFEKVSWDTALDIIAHKLLNIKNKHGGEAIVRGIGAPITEENRDGFSQLLHSLGSPNTVGTGHVCHQPRSAGFQSVFGHMPQPDYASTSLILLWGANPLASRRYGETGTGFEAACGRFSRVLTDARKRGAMLIVIDPWRNALTEMADSWLQIQPGTDAALALAMLHVIIGEKLYDTDFVDRWCSGFKQLAQHVQQYTPQWAEKITGIKATEITQVARLYAGSKPALIREGNAFDQYTNAVHTTRAVAMLEAITGNLDVPGGNVFLPYPRLTSLTGRLEAKRLSADTYPLYSTVPFPAFVDSIFTGKPYLPRALLLNHTNPLLVQANSSRVGEALSRLELLVVCDIFMTATARMADIVLPEATPLERWGFRGYASRAGGFLALRRPAIEPQGEARPLFEMEYELACRLGLKSTFGWRNSQEWITQRLGASNVSFEKLHAEHIVYTTPPVQYRKYLVKGFDTPSQKVELFSQSYEDLGYEPLPVYKDADMQTDPGLKDDFPLIGTTYRSPHYTHSQFRNIPSLRRLEPEALLRINPTDAIAAGIGQGQIASVESPQGEIRIKSRITYETMPGVVIIDFGWGNPWDGGPNVNLLTTDSERDPVSCSTPNHRFRCRVSRV